MKIMIWLLVVPGLLWAILRLGGGDRGLLVQLLAFTPYVAAWSVLPIVLALATRHWAAGALAVVAAAVLAGCVLPRAIPSRTRTTGVALPVMSSNMLAGGAAPDAMVKLVRDNDIAVLAVQEFSPDARAGLSKAGLDELLPYSSLADEAGTTGSGLYSRFPVTAAGARRNGGGFLQAYATIQPPGAAPLVVESAHPNAPYAVSALPDWRRDLASQPHADPTGPARILLGDFNATLDHRAMRDLVSHGYRDAADAVGKGLVPTWGPYHGPRRLPPITIDHVLVDERIGVRDLSVHRIPRSDHRAVLAFLTVPASSVAGRAGPA